MTIPVMVMGPYRTGTSCVAGILHHLGVHWGSQVGPGDELNPKGYFEDLKFANLVRTLYCEGEFQKTGKVDESLWVEESGRRRWLKEWFDGVKGEGKWKFAGAKHPMACLAGEDLINALGGNLHVIATNRQLDDTVASMSKTRWTHGASIDRDMIVSLFTRRDEFLERFKPPVLWLDHDGIQRDPRLAVEAIWDFLRIPVTCGQFRSAISFVTPAVEAMG